MLKRACILALATVVIVTQLSPGIAYAQLGDFRIPGIPTQQNQQVTPVGDKSMGQLLQEREQRLAQQHRRSSIFGTIVTIVGAAACGAFRNDVSAERQVMCAAAGALLGYGTYLLSNAIQQQLEANDQRRMLQAASASLRTGEPSVLDFPESSATGSVTPAGNRTTREASVDVFYDSARVTNLSNISVVAQPVSWNRRLDVRDAPAASGRSTGVIEPNSVFYLSGRVGEEDWYMVSQRVRDGTVEGYVVVGYVNLTEVRPAPPEQLLVEQAPATIRAGTVLAVMQCDELAFQVRDERGRTVDDTSTRCLGPEGTLLSA